MTGIEEPLYRCVACLGIGPNRVEHDRLQQSEGPKSRVRCNGPYEMVTLAQAITEKAEREKE